VVLMLALSANVLPSEQTKHTTRGGFSSGSGMLRLSAVRLASS
jgi:hypothetical protein